ncbi:MAG: SRPBCC family protein [Verrucomicrobiae bacterium]|nr:SRPBCC family protein [Verrucomicrobiae bacterium]
MYTFERKQKIPRTLDEVWDFFSTPKNLQEMTPESLNFEILSENENKIYEGQIIEYRIEIMPGIKRRWTTEISEVQERKEFVDEQIKGPYRYWHHRHTFEEAEDGVWMTDRVNFNMPFWILGKLAYHSFVRNRLVEVFDFRSKYLVEKFDALPAISAGCL